jgi:uncharacterized protein YbgA (DUF1722 family)/uncharacterized protein YbbK (DUF523 family)
MTFTDLPDGPIRVLVSSCLLGEKVRYDGGHKRDPFLVETLGRFVEVVPVCPEVECGLPTPREAMRLAGDPAHPRLVTLKTGVDHTGRMQRWTRRKLRDLEGMDLSGYVCKKGSPSSGMEAGMFTKAFMERFPLIPVEEEGRLQDPALRETFVERMFTLRRLRDRIRRGKTRGNLVEFHTDHKFLILAHGRTRYAELGALVAHAKEIPIGELYGRYLRLLMEATGLRTTPAKCADVLMHMMGHVRQFLTSDEKRELLEAIGRHRNRLVPLIVPVTLIRHYVRKYDVPYLERQVFLNPHPVERMLRYHV